MGELAQVLDAVKAVDDKLDDVKGTVGLLDQGINGGNGSVGLAQQVKDHEKFIRANRPWIAVGRIVLYLTLGSITTGIVGFMVKDALIKMVAQ